MITIARFRRVEEVLRQGGCGALIDASEAISEPADAEAFAGKAAYVILNSGFKQSVAAPIFERCMRALKEGSSTASEFGHEGKSRAMDGIWNDRVALFAAYRSAEDKIDFLRSLPWIGPVTAWHLAKNLGGNHAKPDVHMERLARRDKTTTHKLCARLARESGYRVATIDTVLWRACAEGLLNSKAYEQDGWTAAFRPQKFLASRG